MDDKLIRLARKVKTLEDELNRISKIKDLDGLLLANSDMSSRYRKSIAETVGVYKDYISNTKKELQDSLKAIQKEQTEKHTTNKKNIDSLEVKLNKVKDDILNVSTSIDKSIEDIQKDILKDIKDKNNQILLNLDKKDKELKEVKKENTALNKDLKALKDLVGKLELQKGEDGKSAYDIACELGFKGTKEEWIKSLHGKDGQDIELRGLRAFSDVKNDNKMYARKNKKWVEVEEYDDTELRNEISALQTENTRLKATLPATTGEGENITLDKTAEMEFIQPPLPRGNSEQVQLTGSNKFNKNTTIVGSYNCTYTFNDGVYTITSINTQNNFSFTLKLDLSTGSYTLNSTKTTSDSTMLYNSQNEMLVNLSNNHNYYNFSIAENSTSIRFNFAATSQPVTLDLNSLQIVSGTYTSSTMPAYEPYVGGTASPNPSYPQAITNVTGDVEVLVQNKNLFDKTNQYANNYYDDNGNEITSTNSGHFANKIKVKPNTQYTMSGFLIGSNLSNFTRIYFYDGNGNWISRSDGITTVPNTFTTPSNCEYINFQLNNNPSYPLYSASLDTFMVLEGAYTSSNIPTYVPHKEQTYTFPLGTQRMYLGDYLADDGIHSKRDIDIFDGSDDEVWALIDAYFVSPYVENVAKGTVNSICNIATIKTLASLSATDINKYAVQTIPNGRSRFYFRCSQFGTLDDWKAYLAENPITVEYELAEEEITPYTTEQQQAYDEIKQAISYEEQTNISGTSDEANPLFSVEAYQSMKLVLAG